MAGLNPPQMVGLLLGCQNEYITEIAQQVSSFYTCRIYLKCGKFSARLQSTCPNVATKQHQLMNHDESTTVKLKVHESTKLFKTSRRTWLWIKIEQNYLLKYRKMSQHNPNLWAPMCIDDF